MRDHYGWALGLLPLGGRLQAGIAPMISTGLAIGVLGAPRLSLAIFVPYLIFFSGLSGAGVAQLVEHLICNQRVGGSIPSAS